MNKEYIKYGFIQGDGSTGRLSTTTHKGLEINFGLKDDDVLELFDLIKEVGKRTFYVNGYNEILISLGFDSKPLPERTLPTSFSLWNIEEKLSFMKGLYSANGSVIKNGRVAFKSTCKTLILQIQDFLSELGINSYITTNKAKTVNFSNGQYLCKESYDLNIGKKASRQLFYEKIGFVHKYKMENLKNIL